MEYLRFFRTFTSDRQVGAVVPTSPLCVRYVCRNLDRTKPLSLVECGPGTGVFTRHLLDTLHPESVILGLERNAEFAERLRQRCAPKRNGPELRVLCDDARRLRQVVDDAGLQTIDCVLSGIPLSFFSEEDRRGFFEACRDRLAPNGRLLVYQYSFKARNDMRKVFGNVRCERYVLNLPPMFVMEARGREALSE